VNTLLGVKYVLATQPFDHPEFELIGIAYGSYYYARREPFPRVWIAENVIVEANDAVVRERLLSLDTNSLQTVYLDRALDCAGDGDEGGTAAISAYGPNEVTITADGDGGCWFSRPVLSGWRHGGRRTGRDRPRRYTSAPFVSLPIAYRPVRLSPAVAGRRRDVYAVGGSCGWRCLYSRGGAGRSPGRRPDQNHPLTAAIAVADTVGACCSMGITATPTGSVLPLSINSGGSLPGDTLGHLRPGEKRSHLGVTPKMTPKAEDNPRTSVLK
jgi:hypothetical protein